MLLVVICMHLRFDNLTIRTATNEDAKILLIWWNDGDVMAHAGFPKGLRVSLDKIQNDLSSHWDDGKRGRLHIIEIDGKPIGEIHYRNEGEECASIGIKICDSSYHEKGLGTKILFVFVDALFKQMGYKKITVDANATNDRVQHVYENKLGFKKLRFNKDSWRNQAGELQSHIDYELMNHEWFSRTTSLPEYIYQM
jgi:RimJ/RimL family protein N-acetyltransferase